jgi:hypothetical protein
MVFACFLAFLFTWREKPVGSRVVRFMGAALESSGFSLDVTPERELQELECGFLEIDLLCF